MRPWREPRSRQQPRVNPTVYVHLCFLEQEAWNSKTICVHGRYYSFMLLFLKGKWPCLSNADGEWSREDSFVSQPNYLFLKRRWHTHFEHWRQYCLLQNYLNISFTKKAQLARSLDRQQSRFLQLPALPTMIITVFAFNKIEHHPRLQAAKNNIIPPTPRTEIHVWIYLTHSATQTAGQRRHFFVGVFVNLMIMFFSVLRHFLLGSIVLMHKIKLYFQEGRHICKPWTLDLIFFDFSWGNPLPLLQISSPGNEADNFPHLWTWGFWPRITSAIWCPSQKRALCNGETRSVL